MKYTFIFVVAFLMNAESIFAKKQVIEGLIIDKASERVIPGASIRVSGTNRGTYSSSRGSFRLYVDENDTLLISSVGYLKASHVVNFANPQVTIKLEQTVISKKGVDVTGNITVEEIIKRVINKRDENQKKLKTFQGELYSKLVIELGGSLLNLSTGEGSVSLSSTLSANDEDTPDSKKFIIMETYSDVLKDYDKKLFLTTITKRRQTANIPSEQNIMAITEFINFYDDEVNFLNTKIPSPIGIDALDSYNFTLIDKTAENDKYTYIIGVLPNSKIYPRFEGSLKVVEGTYNVVEIDLKPSEFTFIPFFSNISIKQKFSESKENVWYSGFLDVSADAKVEVIKGLLDFNSAIKVTSIFSDAKINQQLPDSLYTKANSNLTKRRQTITVAPTADTHDTLFWKQNSLRELSPKEIEIYAKVDSAVKSDSSNKITSEEKSRNVSFDFSPYFSFDRVASISLGLTPSLDVYNFKATADAYFSFGLQNYYGSIKLELPKFNILKNLITFSATYNSNQGTFSTQGGAYSKLFNTFAAAFVHEDYFDYYGREGFSASIGVSNRFFNLLVEGDIEAHSILSKNTDRSIFENYKWRKNLEALEGNFQVLKASINSGSIDRLNPKSNFDYEISLSSFIGTQPDLNFNFSGVSGIAGLSFPTFSTGYNPMTMTLFFDAGICSDNTPIQFQHRMSTRLFIFNNYGNFYTAPLGFYGGTNYYSIHMDYNLTDLWWRWIGLPTYEGRGLDLIIGGSWGKFENTSNTAYRSTGNDGYSEIGFGLSRIPTFISNVVFWSFNWRFGIGENAKGRTGGSMNIALPF